MKFVALVIFVLVISTPGFAVPNATLETGDLQREVEAAVADSRHAQLASLQIDHLVTEGFVVTDNTALYRRQEDNGSWRWIPVNELADASGTVFLMARLLRSVAFDDPRITERPRPDYQEIVSVYIEIRYDSEAGCRQFSAITVTSESRLYTGEDGTSSSAG